VTLGSYGFDSRPQYHFFGTPLALLPNMKSTRTKLTILFAAMLLTAIAVSAQDRRALATAERTTGDRFTISTRTRAGANVYSVSPVSTTMLNAVDKGLTDLFAVARRNGYGRRLNYSDYSIFVAKADRQNDGDGKYSPAIAVGAAQYAGTDYDKGGYIYAAGMVISNNPMAFVIAEHTKDFVSVSNIVRYEGEHLVLFHNDRRRYEATKDHSQGGSHPILK
jgi:hypothetical protein